MKLTEEINVVKAYVRKNNAKLQKKAVITEILLILYLDLIYLQIPKIVNTKVMRFGN